LLLVAVVVAVYIPLVLEVVVVGVAFLLQLDCQLRLAQPILLLWGRVVLVVVQVQTEQTLYLTA
jgi:hypothetical protein